MKKPIENSEEFLNLIKEWQSLEDKTIASAEELLGKTNNPLVTKEAISIGPDELNALSDMLNSHMEAEADSLCLADEAFRNSELFTTRYLLSCLIADEAKHHGMMNQLNDLKRPTIATSTGTRFYGYIEMPPSDIERSHARRK
jgi:hypothetical protein